MIQILKILVFLYLFLFCLLNLLKILLHNFDILQLNRYTSYGNILEVVLHMNNVTIKKICTYYQWYLFDWNHLNVSQILDN